MTRRISTSEKRGIWFLVLGITLFAFISTPIEDLLKNWIPNATIRLLLGLGLAVILAYFGKFKRYYRK